jgi:TRAP transporter TatT component family protein
MRLRYRCPVLYRCRPVILCGCLCLLICQGCGALSQRSAVRMMGYVAETGMPAYLRETDLELAEPALATSVKLTEALLETAPDDPRLLLQGVQGLAGYTYAFVEVRIEAARGRDPEQVRTHTQRAQRLYQRGLQYGLRLLGQYHPALRQATALPLEALTMQLRHLDREAVPALFWTSFCWGGFLNVERTALETVTALPLFQAMLTRLLELDEGYLYGLPHLLQAVHYASFAAALGGNPAQAQRHFIRAHALSQGRLLLVPLLEAQYYAVQVQDRALFTERLQHVLEAPESLLPEQGLLNAVARHRATLLLRRIDELFL